MSPEEKKLHFELLRITKGFKSSDFFEYKKERNWEKYDKALPVDRLKIIIKEVMIHKNGYYEDMDFD